MKYLYKCISLGCRSKIKLILSRFYFGVEATSVSYQNEILPKSLIARSGPRGLTVSRICRTRRREYVLLETSSIIYIYYIYIINIYFIVDLPPTTSTFIYSVFSLYIYLYCVIHVLWMRDIHWWYIHDLSLFGELSMPLAVLWNE